MNDFFDNLVFSENDKILFANGIPGFETIKEFVIVKQPDLEPFEWLVAADGTKIRFAMINPMLFRPDYNPDIKKSDLDGLGIKTVDDILIYSLVTIMPDPTKSTANLMGPVIINKTNRTGKQIILEDDTYTTKEPIIGKQ